MDEESVDNVDKFVNNLERQGKRVVEQNMSKGGRNSADLWIKLQMTS
ncbi:MAG: hypothetical protein AAGU27_14515 [Dehalobacterium sp.]